VVPATFSRRPTSCLCDDDAITPELPVGAMGKRHFGGKELA
jgi:hypothetical protein